MKSSSASLSPCPSLADAGSTGLGSFAKTLAFMSPLVMLGSLAAQEAPAATPAPDAAKDKDAKPTDVVELPAVTVETSTAPKLSSPKYTQPLVDTPQTVVVIPQTVYAQQGAKSLQDVLRNTPGISFTASENSGVLSAGSFQMRGTDASNSIFIDGIRDSGLSDRDIFNVEQVEVVKGPTGENGRAQAGGYVNLTTKAPRLESFQEIGASYTFDDYDGDPTARATYDINQVLGKTIALRFNALFQEGGVSGREVAENNKWSVAPSLAFGLGTPTRLILGYQHTEQRNIPDRGVPQALVNGPIASGITIPNSTVATSGTGTVTTTTHTLPFNIYNADGSLFLAAGVRPTGTGGVTVPAGAYLDVPVTLPNGTVVPAGTPLPQAVSRPERDTFYGYKSDYEDTTNNLFNVKLEHDINPDALLQNVTRYSITEKQGFYASPGSSISAPDLTTTVVVVDPVVGATTTTPNNSIVPYYYVSRGSPSIQNDITNQIFTNQSNLQLNFDTGFIEHTLSSGLELTREQQYTRNWSNPTTTFPTGTANAPSPTNADAYNPDYNVVIPYAPVRSGWVDAQTDTAALYAYDTLKLSPKWQASLGGRLESYDTDVSSKTGSAATTSQTANDTLFSYKGALLFKPVTHGTIYTSYGNSFTPPGSNFVLSTTATNANNPNLKAQEATNAEVGTKWNLFEGKLLASFAVFKSENTNMPVTVNTPTVHTEQTGYQEVQGWEVGLSGNITPEWLVFLGYAEQEGDYNTGQPAGVDAELAANPSSSGNIWTSYQFPIGLTLGAGAQYFGESNRRQGSTYTVPAYTLYNAMIGYAVTKRLSVQLNVNNLADKLYIRGSNVGGSGSTATRVYIGEPRTYQLSATYRF